MLSVVEWPNPARTLQRNGIIINPAARTVTYKTKTITFGQWNGHNRKFDVFCRLSLGEPATYQELFDDLFGDDPEGGPLEGTKYMMVVLCQLQRKVIDPLGLTVYREHCCRDRGYRQVWIAP